MRILYDSKNLKFKSPFGPLKQNESCSIAVLIPQHCKTTSVYLVFKNHEFIEQKRRVRIKVYLPNSRLGVYIYAWLGSYQKTLSEQINYLKILIDAHRRNTSNNNSKLKTNIIQNFFVTKR